MCRLWEVSRPRWIKPTAMTAINTFTAKFLKENADGFEHYFSYGNIDSCFQVMRSEGASPTSSKVDPVKIDESGNIYFMVDGKLNPEWRLKIEGDKFNMSLMNNKTYNKYEELAVLTALSAVIAGALKNQP